MTHEESVIAGQIALFGAGFLYGMFVVIFGLLVPFYTPDEHCQRPVDGENVEANQ